MRRGALRGFPLFWTGRAASQFGDQITLLALPWLMVETTSSPLATGALEALVFAPMLLFGLPIGAMADRRSRRRTMVEADLMRLVLLASIPLVVAFGTDPAIGHILLVAFLVGVGHAMFEASAQAFLTDLVPRQQLVVANARLSFTEGLAETCGPLITGVLIAAVGASDALAVDAVTFGLSVLAIVLIHRVTERFATTAESMRHAIRDGLGVMFRERRLRTLTVLQAGANLGSGMVAGLIVFFLKEEIHLTGWQAGMAYAANGVGGVAASLVAPRVSARLGLGRTVLAGMMTAGLGFSCVASSTRDDWLAATIGGMFIVGLGVVTVIIAGATLRQHLAPSQFLGRITTSYRTVVNGAVAVGALTGGAVGQWVGVREALVAGAVVYVAVGLAGFLTALNGPDPEEPAAA